MSKKIEITTPFKVGDAVIDEITVKPIMFKQLVDLVSRTMSLASGDGKFFTVLRRERMKAQAEFKAKGAAVVIDDAVIHRLPIGPAKQIIDAIEENEGERGEIVNDGDGIQSPVLYRLGTPIPVAGKDDKPITEIEFSAKTYGDIEDILAETSSTNQALIMIERLANPVEHDALLVLPSWAVNRITIADGITIMEKVLPRFLK